MALHTIQLNLALPNNSIHQIILNFLQNHKAHLKALVLMRLLQKHCSGTSSKSLGGSFCDTVQNSTNVEHLHFTTTIHGVTGNG